MQGEYKRVKNYLEFQKVYLTKRYCKVTISTAETALLCLEAQRALKAVSVCFKEFILQEIPDGIYIFYLKRNDCHNERNYPASYDRKQDSPYQG
jgi:hypothetical protein